MEITKPTKGLTAYQLKLIAIIAMTCDHFAYILIPSTHPINIVLRLFGKFTFPIMCFFIAEGYYHTRNLLRYAVRLGIFALISHIPYVFFVNWASADYNHTWGVLTLKPASVIFTLLCGLMALAAWDRIKPLILRIPAMAIFCFLPYWMQADWKLGTFVILAFGVFRESKVKQLIAFLLASLPLIVPFAYRAAMQEFSWLLLIQYIGFYLAFLLLQWYNGQRGGSEGSKWMFYVFYPVHFLVLANIIFPILYPIFYPILWAK